MKGIFLFFLFLIVTTPVLSETPLVQVLYGTDAKVAYGDDNVLFPPTGANSKEVILTSPKDEKGNEILSAVYFLFNGKGNEGASGMTFFLDVAGVAEGYFSIVDTKKSKIGNIRELIFPIGDLREDENGKIYVKIANPRNYVDKDGKIEVHISICGGQALTLNSISVEFIKDKTESGFAVPVHRWHGAPPPDVSNFLLSFHHGEFFLWMERIYDQASGRYIKGFGLFEGWSSYQPPPNEGYIFHFNRGEEVEK